MPYFLSFLTWTFSEVPHFAGPEAFLFPSIGSKWYPNRRNLDGPPTADHIDIVVGPILADANFVQKAARPPIRLVQFKDFARLLIGKPMNPVLCRGKR